MRTKKIQKSQRNAMQMKEQMQRRWSKKELSTLKGRERCQCDQSMVNKEDVGSDEGKEVGRGSSSLHDTKDLEIINGKKFLVIWFTCKINVVYLGQ